MKLYVAFPFIKYSLSLSDDLYISNTEPFAPSPYLYPPTFILIYMSSIIYNNI